MTVANVKPGDIGFCLHTDTKISRTIAWFMGSKYSHAFLVAGEFAGKTVIIETSDFEVTINTLDRYVEDTKTRLAVYSPAEMSDEERQHVVSCGMGVLGQVYGYPQLLSFGVRRLLMRVGIRIPNFIRQGVVCNESVIYAYQAASSYPELSSLDPESIDVQELLEIITARSRFALVLLKAES